MTSSFDFILILDFKEPLVSLNYNLEKKRNLKKKPHIFWFLKIGESALRCSTI
jgi:hypothetical protein